MTANLLTLNSSETECMLIRFKKATRQNTKLTQYQALATLALLGHRLGDDLVDWNSGVSVRPSVRPQKVFPISI